MYQGRQTTDLFVARVQLLGGIVFAVLIPTGIRYGLADHAQYTAGLANLLCGTLAAVVIGDHFYQRVIKYPGATAAGCIVPVFGGAYAAVFASFFLLRLDYSSRALILLSFVGSVFWYHACYTRLHRGRTRCYGVVARGAAAALPPLPLIEWCTLTSADAAVAGVDGIVADFREPLGNAWERMLAEWAISGLPVYHVKQVQEAISGRVAIEQLSENNFGALIPGLAYPRIKLAVDFALALVVAVVLLPVLLLIALAVRLDSPGPALFRQRRVGFRGATITVVKFRTMAHCPGLADASRDAAITLANDQRITRLGRWLRRSRIDELPQIINVLRGELSWIGPRPEAIALSQWYEDQLPFYRYRHIVRPGISGWAQVNQGHVADIEGVLSKLHYDFYYIKYFTATLDFLILIRTIQTMLTGFGAK